VTARLDRQVFRRFRNGLGANIYGQVVTVIVQIVGVPILLHIWGTRLYGEWLILSAIPTYLSMSDLGFSQSAANDMTARVARGDRFGALTVFQSLNAWVLLIAASGMFLATGLLWSLPLHDWLHSLVMGTNEARWILWLLAVEVFIRLPNGLFHAGFRANGDYALHVVLENTVRLVQFAGIWTVALMGGGPVGAACAFLGVRVVATPAIAFVLNRRHRWLHFGFKHAKHAELRRLTMPALANMAMPLAQAMNTQGMVLAVGVTLGPMAVVAFSTLRTLTRLALQMVLSVKDAAEPELAHAYGTNNLALMESLYVNSIRAGLWLALSAALGLLVFGDYILRVWTHGKVAMSWPLFVWLLSSAVAGVLWNSSLIVLKAANRHLRAATVLVFTSVAVVGVTGLLLLKTRDLTNAGLVLLCLDVVMTLYTQYAASRLLAVNPLTSLIRAVNPCPLLRSVRLFGKAQQF
jgi:O-antigen/teichoic acid export membrane protein